MSYQTRVLYTNNMLITNYDLSKVFILNNRYMTAQHTNSSYVDQVYPMGTVMGRNFTTGEITPLISTATDGSQFPVGILAQDYTVIAGSVSQLMYCIQGDVAKEEIGFINGTDTFTTVVSSRQLQDRIASDTAGIILKDSLDLTDYDNPSNGL